MADVLAPSTTPRSTEKGKSGLRKALRKWKDRLKVPKRPSSSATSQDTPSRAASGATTTTPPPPPPPPDALFAPTTQTTIISPNDPRNASSPNSTSSSPQSTLRKRGSKMMRRNTAPADYFSNANTSNNPEAETVVPLNTITTTITALAAPPKNRPRYRLSLSKRSSIQHPPPRPLLAPAPLVSPAPSAPNPLEHEDRRATFQYTTAAEIAARTEQDKEMLVKAAEVIRRDKPKDWLDPQWREKEARELEEKRKERETEMEAAGNVKLGRDETDSGPLKRWEWGK